MKREDGIILDLFPPISWKPEDIKTALEIQMAADGEDGWQFTEAEIAYLSLAVSRYMTAPTETWGENFSVDAELDFDDPTEDGRIIIDMVYPEDMEPPASLRV